MNDRELLELAAKAAGLEVHAGWQKDRDDAGKGDVGLWLTNGTTCWNPLTDDGHALRLAVKLRMPLWFEDHAVACNQRECGATGWRVEAGVSDLGGYAATRRAITLAAAEIGRDMK